MKKPKKINQTADGKFIERKEVNKKLTKLLAEKLIRDLLAPNLN